MVVRRCWAPSAWPTRPSRPRWVPERPGVPRATAVVDLVDRLEALAVGRPSNAATSTEMVRTSSGSPSVGPRSRAPSRTVETSSLRGRRARSSRVSLLTGCGRRAARTSSGACCSPLGASGRGPSGHTHAARQARAARTRMRHAQVPGTGDGVRVPAPVPASARDIAAPVVPRRRYTKHRSLIEYEPFGPALHGAWEAEINAKLAPAN